MSTGGSAPISDVGAQALPDPRWRDPAYVVEHRINPVGEPFQEVVAGKKCEEIGEWAQDPMREARFFDGINGSEVPADVELADDPEPNLTLMKVKSEWRVEKPMATVVHLGIDRYLNVVLNDEGFYTGYLEANVFSKSSTDDPALAEQDVKDAPSEQNPNAVPTEPDTETASLEENAEEAPDTQSANPVPIATVVLGYQFWQESDGCHYKVEGFLPHTDDARITELLPNTIGGWFASGLTRLGNAISDGKWGTGTVMHFVRQDVERTFVKYMDFPK